MRFLRLARSFRFFSDPLLSELLTASWLPLPLLVVCFSVPGRIGDIVFSADSLIEKLAVSRWLECVSRLSPYWLISTADVFSWEMHDTDHGLSAVDLLTRRLTRQVFELELFFDSTSSFETLEVSEGYTLSVSISCEV